MTRDEVQELVRWLPGNYSRPAWEVICLIAEKWPDATAAEMGRALFQTQEVDVKDFSIAIGHGPPIEPLELFGDLEGDLDSST